MKGVSATVTLSNASEHRLTCLAEADRMNGCGARLSDYGIVVYLICLFKIRLGAFGNLAVGQEKGRIRPHFDDQLECPIHVLVLSAFGRFYGTQPMLQAYDVVPGCEQRPSLRILPLKHRPRIA